MSRKKGIDVGALLDLVPPPGRSLPTVQFATRGGPFQCKTHSMSLATCTIALGGQDGTPCRSTSPPLAKEVKVTTGIRSLKSALALPSSPPLAKELKVSLDMLVGEAQLTQNYYRREPSLSKGGSQWP